MSKTILTLFGEEMIPEEINAVGRSRAAKKEKTEEEKPKVRKKKTAKEETAVDTPVAEAQPAEEIVQAEEPAEEMYIAPVNKKGKDILEGFKGDKQYYSIGEVAKVFDVKTSHIRFWTNEFAMKVRTTKKGDRLYTPAQIREIRTIYHLVKERGFTISGAKAKLKEQKKMTGQSLDLRQSLLQLRNRLVTIKNQLA